MCETNTLVIYKLPKQQIGHVVEELGKPEGLLRWVQLRFMRRVMAVFDSQQSAKAALPKFLEQLKTIEGCEGASVGFSIADVASLGESHLKLPDPGRLWFVSPPPSPPNEWEESLEEAPNKQTNYESKFNEQLMRALQVAEEADRVSLMTPVEAKKTPSFSPDSPRTVTIIEAHDNEPALQVTADDGDYSPTMESPISLSRD